MPETIELINHKIREAYPPTDQITVAHLRKLLGVTAQLNKRVTDLAEAEGNIEVLDLLQAQHQRLEKYADVLSAFGVKQKAESLPHFVLVLIEPIPESERDWEGLAPEYALALDLESLLDLTDEQRKDNREQLTKEATGAALDTRRGSFSINWLLVAGAAAVAWLATRRKNND